MQFIYQTDRLLLKVLTPEYASAVNRFYQENRHFLEPFEPQRPVNFYQDDFHRSNLRCEYDAFLRLTHIRYWLLPKDAPDCLLGTVCFSNILHGAFQKCMAGYKLGQPFCRHGYMQEALSFLLPLLTKELRLHRIEAYVQPDNAPSIRLLSKLGFAEEGYLKQYAEIQGQWTDHLIFSYISIPSSPFGSSRNQ